VTFLAKTKTTFQLVALGAELLITNWGALGLDTTPQFQGPPVMIAHGLLWIAALITLWTGWEYVRAARTALPHEA
jgi:CDP-diacylglycerol--glycerol-3-phosphate 3-phosphatidyltransferase